MNVNSAMIVLELDDGVEAIQVSCFVLRLQMCNQTFKRFVSVLIVSRL